MRKIIGFIFCYMLMGAHGSWAQWVGCEGQRVWQGNQLLEGHGVKVFYPTLNYLLILDQETKEKHFCRSIGAGWTIEQFREFSRRDNPKDIVAVVQVRGYGSHRYFDIQSGEEVYLSQENGGKVLASYAPAGILGKPVDIIQEWSGGFSQITSPEYHRIVTEAEWRKFWFRHTNDGSLAPYVSFIANMVVVIIPGKKANGEGIRPFFVQEFDDAIQFNFYRAMIRDLEGLQTTSPFGFYIIPRSLKKLILRENMQKINDDFPVWKIVKELEAL